MAAFFLASPLLAIEGSASAKTERVERFTLGKDVVAEVRKSFENREFSEFFLTMDDAYRKADLKSFLEKRGEKEESLGEFEEKFFLLQREKNAALKDLLSDKDHSLFAQKVRFLSSNILTLEQEKALSKLYSLIFKAPNGGESVDENSLIDIDIEYEVKLSLLNGSDPDFQKKHLALRMEKMEKMMKAAKDFEDMELKKALKIAKISLDTRLARNLDGDDLYRLMKEQSFETELEKNVCKLLENYREKFQELLVIF